jgi:hypothetical protein
MQEFRIYTKPKAKAQAKQRLADTVYRQEDAITRAGQLALRGLWVTVTTAETAEPSRWD